MRKTWQRGPETVSDALTALDSRQERLRYSDDTLPRWLARGRYPELEGVALEWRIGKDLTGALK